MSSTSYGRGLALAGMLCMLVFSTAHAQRIGRMEQTETNVDSYYFYVQPGATTVQVHVMGAVRSPGVYELSQGTDLGTLLALSGGPLSDVRQRRTRREVTVRLFRPAAGGGQELIYESTLEGGASEGEAGAYPTLQDGDRLNVEVVERTRFGLSNILTIVNSVALVALAVERLGSAR